LVEDRPKARHYIFDDVAELLLAIWTVLENEIKRFAVIRIDPPTQLLNLRVFHNVPPDHF
jgi:hypothetical protein